MNIGLIGYGAFGEFLARVLVKYGNIYVYEKAGIDKPLPNRIIKSSLEEAASCQVIIIATSLSAMPSACEQLAKFVKPETIVMDVCSVKTKPVQIMKQHLGGKCQLIATHPLFGPQTVQGTNLAGQKIVVYPIEVKNYSQLQMLLRDFLRLEIIEMDPDEHDKQVAWIHALTFFAGRGLLSMDLPKNSQLATGYYQKLLELVELERSHTVELFETIEQGNPYAAEVRDKFIKVLQDLNQGLKEENE